MSPVHQQTTLGKDSANLMSATQRQIGSQPSSDWRKAKGREAKRPSTADQIAGFVAQNTQGRYHRLDLDGI